jgi:hypothetical protein
MHKKKIVYVYDFSFKEIQGGAESNDAELLKIIFSDFNIPAKTIKSSSLTPEEIKRLHTSGYKFLVGNFAGLKKECMDYLSDNCKYIIYEHDHKYLPKRDPGIFSNYVAPPEQIINSKFYKNATKVFSQSKFHKNIIEKNLKINNIVSLGGNLWSAKILKYISDLSLEKKEDMCSIMSAGPGHKNIDDAIKFCKLKNYKYTLIPPCPHEEFLKKLSKNDKFVFFPRTPETLSRIVVEAKMLGCKIFTNSRVGATKEEWFSLNNKEIIDIMFSKRKEIPSLVLRAFGD